MSFSHNRLTPWLAVVSLALAVAPAAAQFVAPTMFSPLLILHRGRRRGGRRSGRRGGRRGGYGTQWMRNPYQGYLNGAAAVTTANAQYQLTIQRARLLREQARRSALQTRRATLEERLYEQAMKPTTEELRQKQLRRSLERSRHNPPASEIWSGLALNDLLRDIQDAHTRGIDGPDVPLTAGVLKNVNLTAGVTYGGAGLLKNGGKLTWPYALRHAPFEDDSKKIDAQIVKAVEQAKAGPVSAELLDGLGASLKHLEEAIDDGVNDMTPTAYVQSTRYVRELKQAQQLLQQSDVAKYFHPAWKAQGKTVGELVKQMTEQGLHFAPAVSGEESYYTSLHRSLVDYDAGLAQLQAIFPNQGSTLSK